MTAERLAPGLPAARLRRILLRVAAALAVLGGLCHSALSPGVMLARRDVFRLYLPLESFFGEELRRGHLPTWFPYDGIGASFVGSAVGGVLDPLKYLVLLLSPDQAVKWEVLILLAVAGAGAWIFARRLGATEPLRWLALVGYAGSGYLLSMSESPIYLHSAALLPWVAVAAIQLAETPGPKSMIWLAMAMCGSAVGGDVQAALLQAVLIATYLLFWPNGSFRPRLLWAGAAAVITVLALAPILGPIGATAAESGRAAGLSLSEATSWSLHPLRLLELIIGPPTPPGFLEAEGARLTTFFGGAQRYYWASSEFVGLGLVWLGVVATFWARTRAARFHLVLCVVALGLALGSYLGLYGEFFKWVPFWRSFRYPEKLMPFALVGLIGAAVQAEGVVKERPKKALLALLGLGLGLGCVAIAASESSMQVLLHWLQPEMSVGELPEVLSAGVRLRAIAALAIIILMCLMVWKSVPGWAWALVVLSSLQALWVDSGLIWVRDRALATTAPALLAPLRDGLSRTPGRIRSEAEGYIFSHSRDLGFLDASTLGDMQALAPDLNGRFGIGNICGYLPAMQGDLVNACGRWPKCGTPCARRLGGRFCIESVDELRALPNVGELRQRAEIRSPALALVEDPQARALVSLPRIEFAGTKAEVEAHVAHDPPETAWRVGSAPAEPEAQGSVTATRPSPDQISIDLDLNRAGTVVVAEQCSKGWRATLDGSALALDSADLALCAFRAPIGKHQVRMKYVPPGWPWVWLAWAIDAGLLLYLAWRSRKLDATFTSSP